MDKKKFKSDSQKRLISKAIEREEDIKHGSVLDIDEVKSLLFEHLKSQAEEVSNGDYVTQEDLGKEAESW